MLYLIINENNKPENRWSIDPENDFAGLSVLGEAMKDASGEFENGDWLDIINGQAVVNQQKKSQIQAATTAQHEDTKMKREALAYLASTDWYIIREMDSGVQCPSDIKLARQIARERI